MSDQEARERYQRINDKLQDNFLCVPPYDFVTTSWLHDLDQKIKSEDEDKGYINFVTEKIIDPYTRAFQNVYRYRELKTIFEPNIYRVIEYATICFYEGNYICSYLSLFPIVESLLKKFTNSEFNSPENQLGENGKTTRRLEGNLQCFQQKLDSDFLIKYLVTVVPGKIFKSSEDSAINRNGALHGLERILNADEVMLSNCALFLVIDVVAELYLRENISQYDVLNIGVTPTHKDNLLNLYNIIYQSAFESSLNNGRINIVNNLFLKENLSEDDINEIHAKISGIES